MKSKSIVEYYGDWTALVERHSFLDLKVQLGNNLPQKSPEMITFKLCFEPLSRDGSELVWGDVFSGLVKEEVTAASVWTLLDSSLSAPYSTDIDSAAFITGAGMFFAQRYELGLVAALTAFLIRKFEGEADLIRAGQDLSAFLKSQKSEDGFGYSDPFLIEDKEAEKQRRSKKLRDTFLCSMFFESKYKMI